MWGDPVGGVAVFDTQNASFPVPTVNVTSTLLAKTNRVKQVDRYTLALPLETRPIGSVAIVSIDPANPHILHQHNVTNDTIYCLEVGPQGKHIIGFGFNNGLGHVFAVRSEFTLDMTIVALLISLFVGFSFAFFASRRRLQEVERV